MSKATDNLRDHQQQIDADGAMVGVSRQAVVETLAEMDRMRAALKPFADMAEYIEREHPGWYHHHFQFTDPQIKMTWLIDARAART